MPKIKKMSYNSEKEYTVKEGEVNVVISLHVTWKVIFWEIKEKVCRIFINNENNSRHDLSSLSRCDCTTSLGVMVLHKLYVLLHCPEVVFFFYNIFCTTPFLSCQSCIAKNLKTVLVLPCFTGYLNLIPDIFLGFKFYVLMYTLIKPWNRDSTFIAQWKLTFWCQNVTVNAINF